jgi:ligand-binding SRPBCC domain-containing protein
MVRFIMRHHFTTSQWVPYPVEPVFAFFADPYNLPPLMPRWQKARVDEAQIVAPPVAIARDAQLSHRIAAGTGSILLISFRPVPLSPIRLTWEAAITEFSWNEHFCDEQRCGPFAYWKHCHRVREEERDGVAGTNVTDDVTYEMKLGAAGEVAHTLVFASQIRQLFAYRQRQVAAILPHIAAGLAKT